MRTRRAISLVVMVAVLCQTAGAAQTASPQAPPRTPQDQALIAEFTGVWNHAQALDKEGKTADAIVAANQALAIVRRLSGNNGPDLVHLMRWIGQRYELTQDFDAALKVRVEAAQLLHDLAGPDHWETIDARTLAAFDAFLAKLPAAQRAQVLETFDQDSQAQALKGQGKYREAAAAGARAVQMAGERIGADHPITAVRITNLAAIYQAMGDLDRAEPLYQRALAVKRAAYGNAHPETARDLNELGVLYDTRGDYARAEAHFLEALSMRRKIVGDQHPLIPPILNNLALMYSHRGDYARAEPLYRQALDIRERALGPDHPETLAVLGNLGHLHQLSGDYARAEPVFERVLAAQSKVLGDEHEDTAITLMNLGTLYRAREEYTRALPLLERADAVLRRLLGPDHEKTIISTNNIAGVYEMLGDYARAEPLYRQALASATSAFGSGHSMTAMILNNLALLNLINGDYARAEPLLQQALDVTRKALGSEHQSVAVTLNNLGILYSRLGDFKRAEALVVEALAIRRKVLGETHPLTADNINNLALLYDEAGDVARAEPLYQQALEMTRKALGNESASLIEKLNNLGMAQRARGDLKRAEATLQEALAIAQKTVGPNHRLSTQGTVNLAMIYVSAGDAVRAAELFRSAMQTGLATLKLASVIQSERQQLAMGNERRHLLDAYLSFAPAAKLTAGAGWDNVLAWKGLVLSRQRANRAVTDRPELQPAFVELQAVASELARLALKPPATADADSWRTRIADLSARKERLEADLARASVEFRRAIEPPTTQSIRAILPADTALVDVIEYWHKTPQSTGLGGQERRVLAFILHGDAIEARDLGPVKPIADAIDAWRGGLGATAASVQAGDLLRRTIWEPIEAVLGGGGSLKQVIVSPDGALARLPLAALPGRKPGTYLLEDWAIATISTPQVLPDLLAANAASRAGVGLLAIGDVNYDGRAANPSPAAPAYSQRAARDDTAFTPLPGTRGELDGIAAIYRKAFGSAGLTTLAGAAASEGAVRRDAQRQRYLHLATHGFFAAARFQSALDRSQSSGGRQMAMEQSIGGYHPGLLSGLVLAGANQPTPSDDGILTAEEVSTLDLSHVELAVLSACETGLGQVAGGEGLLGLQRAFQTAGARTVIASMWKVDDEATRAIMERFYANLWTKNMSTLAALREAQLWMLREGEQALQRDAAARGLKLTGPVTSSTGRSPFYWGAFVLSGDWR
jgi:CHAT domain-containing protein/tetratricopeptide (TPR) repeat protein